MTTLTLFPGTFKQSTFAKVGYDQKYDKIYLKKGAYTAKIPYELNSGTTISGDTDATINLIAKASTSIFSEQVPIFGQVEDEIKDITIENIKFNGQASKQIVRHGDGFHNFVGLKNANNITMRNLTISDTQGDGGRFYNSENINYYDNTILGIGHDGLYVIESKNVDAYNNLVYLRSNSALRCNNGYNVYFHDNTILRTDAYSPAYSPGIQIQKDDGKTSWGVEVYNNYISGSLGPGIWVYGNSKTNNSPCSVLNIHNNLIVDCGQMPYDNGISGTGGIVFSGWDKSSITNNTIVNSKGYGILCGTYVLSSENPECTIDVSRNIITGTKISNYPGLYSGGGIVNLLPDTYTVSGAENCLHGNIIDCYKVDLSDTIKEDPLFVGKGNNHLKSQAGHYTNDGYMLDSVDSPCIFSDHELGRYNQDNEASVYHSKPIVKPNELIGDNCAVIVLCKTKSGAMALSEALIGSEYLDGEMVIVYCPK